MIVELISVGTEILLGNIVNTNAAYLAEKCAALGFSCYYQSVVGDNEERLQSVLKTACERSDIVIISGGLGPTKDDITKEVVAKAVGKNLVMDERSKDRMEQYLERCNLEITANNLKQAMIPEGAVAVDNENGTAPGVILNENGTHIILLPGPPDELIPMFENRICEYMIHLECGNIYSQAVKICGISESKVETIIEDLIEEQNNPTIASYAKSGGEVHLRVTAKANSEKQAKKLVKPLVKELKVRFGDSIYSTDENITLEKAVVDLLISNKLTISTVESCTGGMVAARLINVPGVSEVFKSGHITYSNKSKRKILGIKKSLIDKNGAVSDVVAKLMAKGASVLTKADVAVAVTGIAGPDGGTVEKPVGLVYIACSVCGKITVQEYHFSGDRAKIRENTTTEALMLLRKCILEYSNQNTQKEKK